MSVIKAFDLAYGRLRSPDLDKQEEFLTDFGMIRADRTKNALYMRGTDAPHHLHVTELGEPRYVGIAVHAAGMELVDAHRVQEQVPVESVRGGEHVHPHVLDLGLLVRLQPLDHRESQASAAGEESR